MNCKCEQNDWKRFEMSENSRERYPTAEIMACRGCGRIYIAAGPTLVLLDDVVYAVNRKVDAMKQQYYRETKQKHELIVDIAEKIKESRELTSGKIIDLCKSPKYDVFFILETLNTMVECDILEETRNERGKRSFVLTDKAKADLS